MSKKKDTFRPLSEDRIKDLPIITISTDPYPPAVGEQFELTVEGMNFKDTLCLQIYHYFNSKGEPIFPYPWIKERKYYADITNVRVLSLNCIKARVLINSKPGSFYIVALVDASGEVISGRYITVYSLPEARALRPIKEWKAEGKDIKTLTLDKDVYETKELCKLLEISDSRFSELKATIEGFPEPDNPEGPLPFCYSNCKAKKICAIVPEHRSKVKRTPPLRGKKQCKSTKKK